MTSPARAGLADVTREKLEFFNTAATGEKKMVGATAATVTLNVALAPLPLFTTTGCDPAGVSTGTCALICPGPTYTSGAGLPAIVTRVPLSDVGSVRPTHPFRSVATFTNRWP